MSRLLITGCGRSGTMLAAEIVRTAGIHCGHEDVFKLNGARPFFAGDWGRYGAESSWLAVPYLSDRELYEKAVLLVRHPLAVMRSWLQLDLLSSEPPTDPVRTEVMRAVYRFRPEIQREDTQVDRIALMWLYWISAALPYASSIVRMEALVWNASVLLDALGIAGQVDVSKLGKVNEKRDDKIKEVDSLEWSDLRPELRREVRRLADSLGYKMELA